MKKHSYLISFEYLDGFLDLPRKSNSFYFTEDKNLTSNQIKGFEERIKNNNKFKWVTIHCVSYLGEEDIEEV